MQQTQTLSLRISEVLRKRLEDVRKLTALRKGESVSTSGWEHKPGILRLVAMANHTRSPVAP